VSVGGGYEHEHEHEHEHEYDYEHEKGQRRGAWFRGSEISGSGLPANPGEQCRRCHRPDWLLTRHSIFLRFCVLVLNEMVLVLVIETNRLRRRFLSTSERVVLNR